MRSMAPAARPIVRGLFLALVVCASASLTHPPSGDGYGVFVRLAERLDGSVAEVATQLEATASELDWEVLSVHRPGTPEGACSFESRVLVLNSPPYTRTLMLYGTQAAFAAPIRLAVFADEHGVHVGATNPYNLNRTMVDEGVPGDAWSPWVDRLQTLAKEAFGDRATWREYGQMRDDARIGKTFGIMAGGPFDEQIETVVALRDADAATVARRLHEGLRTPLQGAKWGVRSLYLAELSPQVFVVGVSGQRIEADAFRIVGGGNDAARNDMACPGLDHAPAFPIEVVVADVEGETRVQLVDEMYRMKMFFEDAGKMAFAKNMGMPGSIEDEIEERIHQALR